MVLANDDKKYYVSRFSKRWESGLALCMRYDMDFVNFDSKPESDYFVSLTDDIYWVGITDSSTEGVFKNYNVFEKVSSSFISLIAQSESAVKDCVYLGKSSSASHYCDAYVNVACERRTPRRRATKSKISFAPDPANDKFDYTMTSSKLNEINEMIADFIFIFFFYRKLIHQILHVKGCFKLGTSFVLTS